MLFFYEKGHCKRGYIHTQQDMDKREIKRKGMRTKKKKHHTSFDIIKSKIFFSFTVEHTAHQDQNRGDHLHHHHSRVHLHV